MSKPESYEDLWNALQRIDSVAVTLPTFEVRHEGGLDAAMQNIVDAILAASARLEAAETAGAGKSSPVTGFGSLLNPQLSGFTAPASTAREQLPEGLLKAIREAGFRLVISQGTYRLMPITSPTTAQT